MKKIKIVGKRNIDGFKETKKETKREKVLKITDTEKKTLNEKSQVELLNKLYLNEDYPGISFMKKEVKRKIASYKNQDVKKNKYNKEKLITYEECLTKLVISKLKCYYCKKNCLIYYENKLEENQWTLDRLDNSIGHEEKNVVVCCYKCNIKRGRLDDEKFKFTKQLRVVKGF